jgi:hypothetical protein
LAGLSIGRWFRFQSISTAGILLRGHVVKLPVQYDSICVPRCLNVKLILGFEMTGNHFRGFNSFATIVRSEVMVVFVEISYRCYVNKSKRK